ncbi:uncharacterized protein VDAG_05215 [Verticillium dahliae VdLs.17]|uniref:BRCT domain-containing protein n=1 Tax=Verticillium dahliae (strain VdLs.17 / ATCC MYA-4575 / FGSC 10137) TaxID=498257 RepID=G2X4Y3_VERDV|nr:uncharacterized protein VDAG_05215 [Verticillium dahliae VdLs.17]EGY23777.1 hypothetical protein VDAG_05215 [Verticillium dahliae VdLs.17]
MIPINSVTIVAPMPTDGVTLEEAKSWIEELGAVYHKRVRASTSVVCTTHHQMRYCNRQVLGASQQESFLVGLNWLFDSWDKHEFLDPNKYGIGPESDSSPFVLDGCLITITPTYPTSKETDNLNSVRNAIVRLGGSLDFSGDNLDGMTHLCISESEVPQRSALIDIVCSYNRELQKSPNMSHKFIKIVQHDWLKKCLDTKTKLDEEEWLLTVTAVADDGKLRSVPRRHHRSLDERSEDESSSESSGDDSADECIKDGRMRDSGMP